MARARTVEGDVALFAHGHVLRVLAARWLGLPPGGGQHFLLDTGTLSVLDHYRGIPALKTWNAPLVGYGVANGRTKAATDHPFTPVMWTATTPSRVGRMKP
jgi:broad specificity phosphatase PhoE